jgi:hypothetical protein
MVHGICQLVKRLLQQRRAPLWLTLSCPDSVKTQTELKAARSGLRWIDMVLDQSDWPACFAYRDLRHLHHAAWCAAALTVAFVRAHGRHPFARSVVPLIPLRHCARL